MQLKSTYFGGVLIKNGIRTNIALGNYLVSDAEMNQPKGLFKKPIKDSEKEYNWLEYKQMHDKIKEIEEKIEVLMLKLENLDA